MPEYIKASLDHWHMETGQVGMVLWGGMDENDNPTAFM